MMATTRTPAAVGLEVAVAKVLREQHTYAGGGSVITATHDDVAVSVIDCLSRDSVRTLLRRFVRELDGNAVGESAADVLRTLARARRDGRLDDALTDALTVHEVAP